MTNGQRATSGSGQDDTIISTGQTAGDPLVRATFGSAYTLDGVGNRTQTDLNEPMMPSYNAETTNYVHNPGNILSSADGTTYTHDDNGNRTTKTHGINVTSYTYDSLNRLTQTSTGSRQIQYLYNGLGQRVAKIDSGVRTNYLIDPNGFLPQVLAEMDASNNLIAYYVYDGAGLVAKVTPANQYYFYHYDGLASTIAITDNAGQVVNTYCYSPEGLVGVQETIPNPFQYAGRFGVMAEGNGLYYMRARYYDPETGRFINKDPIGYMGGINLFTYVGNNLVTLVDPEGLHRAWGYFHFNPKPIYLGWQPIHLNDEDLRVIRKAYVEIYPIIMGLLVTALTGMPWVGELTETGLDILKGYLFNEPSGSIYFPIYPIVNPPDACGK